MATQITNSVDIIGTADDDYFIATAGAQENFDGLDGNDTVSFANFATGVTVAGDLIDPAVGISAVNVENIIGSNHDDVLYANSAASGILDGGNGNDVLVGHSGNWLIGGAGTDLAQINHTGVSDLYSNLDATGEYTVVWSDAGEFWLLKDVEYLQVGTQTYARNSNGQIDFSNPVPVDTQPAPQPTTDVQFGGDNNDVFTNTAATRHVLGGAGIDTLLIDGNRGEYGIGQTLDGSGFVVWQGDNFTVLNSVEHLVFRDTTVALNGDGSIVETPVDSAPQNLVFGSNDADDFHQAAGTQYYVGNAGNDRLIINGNSADYGIGATLDQMGIVVWSGDAFDIAFDVEEVVFNDKTVFAANYIDGTFLN